MWHKALAAVVSVILITTAMPVVDALQFDVARLQEQAQARYGQQGVSGLSQWLAMLREAAAKPTAQQLQMVNDFWNRMILGSEDRNIWGQADYWATPLETLGKRGGDCEDFVIGKYFSLVHLGIDPEKLRLVYVRANIGGASVAHMVLGYYETPGAEPLVLDNLMGSILPAGQRRDLQPVFSFNAQGVYVAGSKSAPVSQISRWQGLLSRMQAEGFLF